MYKNNIIIEQNIDVTPFLEEMNPDHCDWVSQQTGNNLEGDKNPYGFLPSMSSEDLGRLASLAKRKTSPIRLLRFRVIAN